MYFIRFMFGLFVLLLTTSNFYNVKLEITDFTNLRRNKAKLESIHLRTNDTLKKYSFDELSDKYSSCEDSLCKSIYANYYLIKAKKVKKSNYIAEGYILQSYVNKKDRLLAIKYTDSAIDITKDLKNNLYPAKAYLQKGSYYYFINRFDEALDNYLLANKRIHESGNNLYLEIRIRNSLGNLKNIINQSEEGIKYFEQNIRVIDSLDSNKKIEYFFYYKNALAGIADAYNRLRKLNQGLPFIKEGLNLAHKDKSESFIVLFRMSYGINRYFAKEYKTAKDTLEKVVNYYYKNSYDLNKAVADLYYAKTLINLKQKDSAITILKDIDSFITDKTYFIEIRDTYQILLEDSKKKENFHEQLYYLNKLIRYDSISSGRQFEVSNKFNKQIEQSKLKEQRIALLKEVDQKKETSNLLLLFLSVLLFITPVLIYHYYKKQKRYKIKFEEVLKRNQQVSSSKKKVKSIGDNNIPEKLIKEIEDKLNDFVKNKKFTDSNITLSSLAKEFNTNSAYLSKIVNISEGKNFSNFLSTLRIEYIMLRLLKDKKYRAYNLIHIAKEAGFNNERSFSRAFTKINSISPSYYIKRLNSLESID
ncbi:helix-turn-helix domain-containing protein [Aquimarina sp. ERC-38]|uniref:helix-turn-helix domain-containing protein n=1 Tax=Aquimarina sp. ERC-38 TaxID=2949996 RepID=UPI00224642D5|nr:helix-turn-helix domain-containing protein [Aquimarina sp. ERC-38]UZO82102.1 helix-turn-helix domain-containing protein [Aquimarina sp. ERC-38]